MPYAHDSKNSAETRVPGGAQVPAGAAFFETLEAPVRRRLALPD
jgi:hypothetical protein